MKISSEAPICKFFFVIVRSRVQTGWRLGPILTRIYDTPPIFFSFDFDSHLIGRKVNHQAGVLAFDSNKTREKTNSTRSLLGLPLLFLIFIFWSLYNSTWHAPEIEASHANLSRVVDCFTGGIHHSRETRPPGQPQREFRRPRAQSRPSAAPPKITKPSQTQFFIPLCLANHTSTDQVTTSLRSSIAVSPSLLPAWGFGAAPATQDIPRAIASSAVPAESIGR